MFNKFGVVLGGRAGVGGGGQPQVGRLIILLMEALDFGIVKEKNVSAYVSFQLCFDWKEVEDLLKIHRR